MIEIRVKNQGVQNKSIFSNLNPGGGLEGGNKNVGHVRNKF